VRGAAPSWPRSGASPGCWVCVLCSRRAHAAPTCLCAEGNRGLVGTGGSRGRPRSRSCQGQGAAGGTRWAGRPGGNIPARVPTGPGGRRQLLAPPQRPLFGRATVLAGVARRRWSLLPLCELVSSTVPRGGGGGGGGGRATGLRGCPTGPGDTSPAATTALTIGGYLGFGEPAGWACAGDELKDTVWDGCTASGHTPSGDLWPSPVNQASCCHSLLNSRS
jgi:hypothetical protein